MVILHIDKDQPTYIFTNGKVFDDATNEQPIIN